MPAPLSCSPTLRYVCPSHNILYCVCVCVQERLKTKCEVYWPREVGCSVMYGGIEVTLTDLTQLADYTVRSLTINKVCM